MGRGPVDDSRPPPWEPADTPTSEEPVLELVRRTRSDASFMFFDADDRRVRTAEDLIRVIRQDRFPIRMYERIPRPRRRP